MPTGPNPLHNSYAVMSDRSNVTGRCIGFSVEIGEPILRYIWDLEGSVALAFGLDAYEVSVEDAKEIVT